MKRVLSAVVFLPLFWLIVKKLPPAVYEILLTVAALLALVELYRFAAVRGHRCHRLLGGVLLILTLASTIFCEDFRPSGALSRIRYTPSWPSVNSQLAISQSWLYG